MKALLFDMDGVVLDSKEVWIAAFKEAANMSREEIESKLVWGADVRDNLRRVGIDDLDSFRSVFNKHLDKVKVPEAIKLILEKTEYKKALITNTTYELTKMILEKAELFEYFDSVVTCDQVERGKPSPDMIFKACENLDVRPQEAVIIGDSSNDMEAGKAAGCSTIGLGIEGDYTIQKIDELPGILKQI
ncbi:MAG: HAD-IA family hydrolase [Candidatus Aenigmatarchaeota archaeon]|nr:HAD family hydrolase [Nanoarchaeota archaeon]